ncbi:uncharacterized protein FOBCDRAFT_282375 [Fusarium oxysporum Fo47]|uniref:uncharacterized protein n=1 Tax=Fusarium oxysporum Fo47 TaxID=660027 RepID=UPI0015993DF1|nr:uncharacterized protein FOBCDRAFT_282375 [Fusarium oxysporum Fo47]QKD62710.1 hypothetical protein FOBCDRAFT_282375 [Fusarium oxysporum Fo47]
MKPLTVADIIPTMSFHTSNSVSSTHQAFRFTEDPESAQLFLSVDSLQCRRPSFPQSATTSGPLKSVYTSYGSKLDKSMGCYKAVAQHDELYIYLDEKCLKVLDNQMWPKDYAKGLPKAAPINGRHIRSLYVGVLAINGQLVYISSKKGEVYPNLFEDDDFTGLAFKAESSQTPAGSNTILIETNLIGGNLAHNKQYVAGQTDSFDSEADPEGKAIRQNEKEGISDMNKFYNKP